MLDKLIEKEGKKIKFYFAKEIVVDPYEGETEIKLLAPIAIRGIVADLVFSQIQWKITGVEAFKAKEIIVPKKYRNLVENSYKIEIEGEFFESWKVNGKTQIREEGNYIRMYIYQG